MRSDLLNGEPSPPASWWGPVWTPRTEIGLEELIRNGTIPLDLAALFEWLIERGASMIVAAGPSGAGKTTLLTGLLEFLPESKQRIYARGQYETFDFAEDADPRRLAILINEISPHLLIYLWGEPLKQLLELARRGAQIFATCHAETVEELLYSLSAYPLRIPAWRLGVFDVVVFLKTAPRLRGTRPAIERVVSMHGDEGRGLEVVSLFEKERLCLGGIADRFLHPGESTADLDVELESRMAELWNRCGR